MFNNKGIHIIDIKIDQDEVKDYNKKYNENSNPLQEICDLIEYMVKLKLREL